MPNMVGIKNAALVCAIVFLWPSQSINKSIRKFVKRSLNSVLRSAWYKYISAVKKPRLKALF